MKAHRIAVSAVMLAAALATLFFAGTAGAQTYTYQWNGTSGTSALWTASGWNSSGTAQSNGTYNARLNVYNNTNSALVYTSAQGYTDFDSATRGLVIGSTVTNGSMIITGGTFSTVGSTGANTDVIGNSGYTGSLTIAGGVYVSTTAGLDLDLATASSVGILTIMNSGSAIVPFLVLSPSSQISSGTAEVNLNGGTLTTGPIAGGYGTNNSFNFNGGTLIASASSTSYIAAGITANVQQGGAFIDPNGYAITIGQALVHSYTGSSTPIDGGLTELGSGTLTLSALNNYTGGTVIKGGILVAANASALGASTGSLTVNTGGTLTLNSNITQGAVTFGGGTISGTATLTGASFTSSGGGLVSATLLGPSVPLTVNSGLLALSASNGYGGGTTVSGGTLQLGNAFALGSTSSGLTVGGGLLDVHGFSLGVGGLSGGAGTIDDLGSTASTLTVGNGNGSGTYSGTILSSSGAINLVKTGAGTLYLSGNNSYTGTTLVNNGLLAVMGSHTGGGAYTIASGGTLGGLGNISATVTMNAGATLFPGAAGPTGTMTLGNLNVAGTNNDLVFNLTGTASSPGSDLLAVTGLLSLAGTTTISVPSVDLGKLGSTNYPLITFGSYSSLTNTPSSDFTPAAGVLTNRQQATFVTVGNTVYMDVVGSAHTLTWNGSGSNTWDNVASNYTWINSSGSADIFVTGDNVNFSNSGGSQTNVNVNAAVAPTTVLVTGSNNYTLSGSGSIGGTTTPLTMQGSGILTLATTGNTYAGGTFVQSGTLAMGAANALPAAGVLTLGTTGGGAPGISGSGTLDLAGFNQTIAGLTVAGGATATSQIVGNSSTSTSAVLTLSGGTSTFGGVIQNTLGSGNQQVGLWVTGSASLTLAGPNTYTGASTINSGSLLQIGNGASGEQFSSATIADNGTLVFNHADALTYSGAVSGSGSLLKQGTGTLTLSSSNGYSGGTTISAGMFNFGNVAALGSGTATFAGNATLQAGASGTVTNALAINSGVIGTLDT